MVVFVGRGKRLMRRSEKRSAFRRSIFDVKDFVTHKKLENVRIVYCWWVGWLMFWRKAPSDFPFYGFIS